jgi:hypothetical protein
MTTHPQTGMTMNETAMDDVTPQPRSSTIRAETAEPATPGTSGGDGDVQSARDAQAERDTQDERESLCEIIRLESFLTAEEIDAILADMDFFLPWFRSELLRERIAASESGEGRFSDMAGFHAMFFLAHVHDTVALPDILACLDAPDDDLYDRYGDALFEDMWQPIARLAPDAIDTVIAFLERAVLEPYSRNAILRGLLTASLARAESRARVVECMAGILNNPALPMAQRADVAYTCGEFDLQELRDAVFAIADHMSRDPSPANNPGFDAEELRQSFTGAMHDNIRDRLGDDIYALQRRWSAWYNNAYREDDDWSPAAQSIGDDAQDLLHPVRHEPKTGRNEPCPCGSGRKFKKCCGKP